MNGGTDGDGWMHLSLFCQQREDDMSPSSSSHIHQPETHTCSIPQWWSSTSFCRSLWVCVNAFVFVCVCCHRLWQSCLSEGGSVEITGWTPVMDDQSVCVLWWDKGQLHVELVVTWKERRAGWFKLKSHLPSNSPRLWSSYANVALNFWIKSSHKLTSSVN